MVQLNSNGMYHNPLRITIPMEEELQNEFLEATLEGNLEKVKELVSQGADIHWSNDEPLWKASSKGHLELVKYFVEHGADPRSQDDASLRHACIGGHLEVVRYLLEHGADPQARENESFLEACRSGHLEIMKLLIEYGVDPHANDEYGLWWASFNGHIEIVKFLVEEEKADIHNGNSVCLYWAVWFGHLEIVKYLLKCGANPKFRKIDFINKEGNFDVSKCLRIFGILPRNLTNKYLYREILKYLLEYGADISLTDYLPVNPRKQLML